MSSDPKPTASGRDPHVGSYRIFVALSEELAEADRRLGHVASATNSLQRHLANVRQLLGTSPVILTPDVLRKLEAEVHSCAMLLAGAGTSATGVSAKVTAARHLARHGVQMGNLRPRPSLN